MISKSNQLPPLAAALTAKHLQFDVGLLSHKYGKPLT